MKEKNIQIEENHQVCSHCGRVITDDDFSLVQGEIVCTDCVENYCSTCERCGALIYDDDVYGDDEHCLCQHCYENHYTRCDNCDCVMHVNDSYGHGDDTLCYRCFNELDNSIHDYGYKPEPIFYGKGSRFFGVELEIDIGGRDEDNAQSILEIGNRSDFVASVAEPELIQYLKERRLYINEEITTEEDM